SVPATTTPAAAISSISRALLRMITRLPLSPRDTSATVPGPGRSRRFLHLFERVLDLEPALVDRAAGVQRHEAARDAVVLDHGLGLLVVGLQPVGDHLGRGVGGGL